MVNPPHVPSQRHTRRHSRAGDTAGANGPDRSRELSTLCHDLRQYVTAGLLLTTLPDNVQMEPETRRRLELLHQTLSHASTLLETAAQPERVETTLLDLALLAQECVDVAEYGHKVRYVSEVTEPPLVAGDPHLVRRALDNMIDNAGRAAGADGDVVVQVGSSHGAAWVEVVDDGPGFGEIAHGTGQGLSVVSSTARSCGGRLEISSGPGPGTTVRLAFPVAGAVTHEA